MISVLIFEPVFHLYHESGFFNDVRLMGVKKGLIPYFCGVFKRKRKTFKSKKNNFGLIWKRKNHRIKVR